MIIVKWRRRDHKSTVCITITYYSHSPGPCTEATLSTCHSREVPWNFKLWTLHKLFLLLTMPCVFNLCLLVTLWGQILSLESLSQTPCASGALPRCPRWLPTQFPISCEPWTYYLSCCASDSASIKYIYNNRSYLIGFLSGLSESAHTNNLNSI